MGTCIMNVSGWGRVFPVIFVNPGRRCMGVWVYEYGVVWVWYGMSMLVFTPCKTFTISDDILWGYPRMVPPYQ